MVAEEPSSTLFSDAMALTPAGNGDSGVYEGELNEHWTIGPKVHGGAMLALCANAARMEHAGGADVQPIAISGNFLSAPDPGPMRLATTVRKRGRRVSLVGVELSTRLARPSGCVNAYSSASIPPHEVPSTWTCSRPSPSRTAASCSRNVSTTQSDGSSGRAESPPPSWS